MVQVFPVTSRTHIIWALTTLLISSPLSQPTTVLTSSPEVLSAWISCSRALCHPSITRSDFSRSLSQQGLSGFKTLVPSLSPRCSPSSFSSLLFILAHVHWIFHLFFSLTGSLSLDCPRPEKDFCPFAPHASSHPLLVGTQHLFVECELQKCVFSLFSTSS